MRLLPVQGEKETAPHRKCKTRNTLCHSCTHPRRHARTRRHARKYDFSFVPTRAVTLKNTLTLLDDAALGPPRRWPHLKNLKNGRKKKTTKFLFFLFLSFFFPRPPPPLSEKNKETLKEENKKKKTQKQKKRYQLSLALIVYLCVSSCDAATNPPDCNSPQL